MNLIDLLIFIFYSVVFFLITLLIGNGYSRPEMKKYLIHGYWLKVMGAIGYGLFTLMMAHGDTYNLYYPEGRHFYELIVENPSNIRILFTSAENFDERMLTKLSNLGYFTSDSNLMVAKFVAFFSIFTFGKFFSINLLFSLLAFTGIWKLFLFFCKLYPELHRPFAVAIIYLPSFIFWNSGIMKDPLCMAAIGWITYHFYILVYERRNMLLNILIICAFGYLLLIVKSYIFASYVPFLFLFIFYNYIVNIRFAIVKIAIAATAIGLAAFLFFLFSEQIMSTVKDHTSGDLVESIMEYQEGYKRFENSDRSFISLGVEFDGSLQSLVKLVPAAITTALFRPFIWEVSKPVAILSSVENLFFLLFFLYVLIRVGPFSFLLIIIRSPLVAFSFLFSIVFSTFVGATTLNFGTLVRYKMPSMPFFLISLIMILYLNNKWKTGAPKAQL